VIVLDTSVLVACFTEPVSYGPALRRAIIGGNDFIIPSLALYEWLRGPRRPGEIAALEAFLPPSATVPFGAEEAAFAARLYRSIARPRGREIDLCIAAYAILREAQLWTLNRADFKDIPGLRLAAF
jgi:predicted nucleic acid-binding protein